MSGINFNLKDAETVKSFTPLNPGEKVPVVITSVVINEDGDLDINFKGTSVDNAGVFNLRVWANSFDADNEKFNAKYAEDEVNKLRQIMEAFLTDAEIAGLEASNWTSLANSVAKILTAKALNIPALLKVIYRGSSDEKITIPRYGSFISTDHRPRALKLDTKCPAGSAVPYDRVEKLSFYGILPTNDGPNEEVVASPFTSSATDSVAPAFANQ